MSIAIRYFTKSKKGNTKKLADAVSEAIGIEALDVTEDLTEKADRLFLINAIVMSPPHTILFMQIDEK